MTYSIFNAYDGVENEIKVARTNRMTAIRVARSVGATIKRDGSTTLKFYDGDKFVGKVHCHPSNNSKFYAVSATGVVMGEHDYLFHTFEGALRFALNYYKVSFNTINTQNSIKGIQYH